MCIRDSPYPFAYGKGAYAAYAVADDCFRIVGRKHFRARFKVGLEFGIIHLGISRGDDQNGGTGVSAAEGQRLCNTGDVAPHCMGGHLCRSAALVKFDD